LRRVSAKRKRIESRYCSGVRVVQPVKRSVTVVEVEKVLDISDIMDDEECDIEGIEVVVEDITIPLVAVEGIDGDGIDMFINFKNAMVSHGYNWARITRKQSSPEYSTRPVYYGFRLVPGTTVDRCLVEQ
jgi:hypothetical protein